jgi:chloramphenicol-sensitive protein RarD
MVTPANQHDEYRRGILYGVLAYGSWGVLPIFFRALEPAGPLEILAQRILWSCVFCTVIWLWKRELAWLWKLARNPRKVIILAVAAYILALNWGVYIYAVSIGNVLESSLGYFINPLMLVLVGVLVLGERMNPLQWSAIALGALAVLVISIDYGRLPWIALTLAISFTAYGYIKKRIGANIGALETMTVESLLLLPFAVGTLVYVKLHANDLTFTSEGGMHTVLLIMLGAATMLPLSWFTAAAMRLPLFMMGLLQFMAPVGQFLVAVFLFQEDVPLARWIGFGFVWLALVLLTVDTLGRANARRRSRRATPLTT